MNAVVRHVRELWGRWWPVPGGLPVAYVIAIWAIGDLRPEHVVIVGVACVLAYAGRRTKQFFLDVSPYLVVGIGYDSVRYARKALVTADRVLGCGLRNAEVTLFHVSPGVTFQDFATAHHHPALDVLFSVPYAIFAYLALVYAGFLYFVDRPRMRHYLWSFMIANYISFVFWLALPAAPPWYIRQHGCAIDMAASPSPAAALLRVDTMLGIHYFQSFYARAASVYGAMPSMHCAYPMLGLLTAWKSIGWKTRPLHILYVIVMFSAAVYLDHHWILDGLAGWMVAMVAVVLAKRLLIRLNLLNPKEPTREGGQPSPASQPA